MKTLKLSLIGIVLLTSTLLSTNVFAKSTIDTSATELRAELMKMIQNPKLKENGIAAGNVQLQFTISPKGEIQIVSINADSEYLSEFVRKKLDNQQISLNDIRKDKVYYLKLRFELV